MCRLRRKPVFPHRWIVSSGRSRSAPRAVGIDEVSEPTLDALLVMEL
jgi:hypothetical protein